MIPSLSHMHLISFLVVDFKGTKLRELSFTKPRYRRFLNLPRLFDWPISNLEGNLDMILLIHTYSKTCHDKSCGRGGTIGECSYLGSRLKFAVVFFFRQMALFWAHWAQKGIGRHQLCAVNPFLITNPNKYYLLFLIWAPRINKQ